MDSFTARHRLKIFADNFHGKNFFAGFLWWQRYDESFRCLLPVEFAGVTKH